MPILDFPSSPTVGQEHVHDESTWVWDGSKWMATTTTGSSVMVGDTAPEDVPEGTIWFDSTTAQTLVFYGNVWVEIGATPDAPSGGGGTGGGGSVLITDSGDILYDEINGQLELVNNSITLNSHPILLGGTHTLNTNDINEGTGTTNKYFTESRAKLATANSLLGGTHTGIQVSYSSLTGNVSLQVNIADGSITTTKLKLNYADTASFPTPSNGSIAYSTANASIYFASNAAWVKVPLTTEVVTLISESEARSADLVANTNTSLTNLVTAQIASVTAGFTAADNALRDDDQVILASQIFA